MEIRVQDSLKRYWDARAWRYSRIYRQDKSGFAKLLDRIFRRAFRARLDETFRYLDDLRGRRVLDAGCGPGLYLLESLRRGASQVVGMDISTGMLECASVPLTQEFPSRKQWRLMERKVEELERDEKYDVVLAMGILEYLESFEKTLSRLASLTSGVLICSFPCRYSAYNLLRAFTFIGKGIRSRLFSRGDVESLAGRTGLRIVKFRRIGPTYWAAMRPQRFGNA